MADYTITRDRNGIPHVRATTEAGMYRGQGAAHATDRGLQMLFMRILGQGRVSECLDASDDSLQIDRFFRRMNWTADAQEHLAALSPAERANLEAYAAGASEVFARSFPWELRLLGAPREPWRAHDCLLLSRMVGYLTLAQGHGEIERMLIELVQAGLDDARLEELFPGFLGGLDRDLICRLKLEDRFIPAELLWEIGAPRMMASNNWAVSGRRTAHGAPILANDPHLETNRLPNVWAEQVLQAGNRWWMGGTMPGLPGILVGRNARLSWGATYAFSDCLDSWIERCRDGQYWRTEETGTAPDAPEAGAEGGSGAGAGAKVEADSGTDSAAAETAKGGTWHPFRRRDEVIRRKNKPDVTVTFWENELGTVEGDPTRDDHVLVTRWSGEMSGARTVAAIMAHFHSDSVADGMDRLGRIETAWNWVLADSDGHIGYQMSGLVPLRRKGVSGLVPLPAWDRRNHWQGFATPEDLPREIDPERGYVHSANENRNHLGKVVVNNVAMGAWRADRVARLLEAEDRLDAEAMRRIHGDLWSGQAAAYMAVLRPLLPDTAGARTLAEWDHCYDAGSEGAWWFERFYRALVREVFGRKGMGLAAIDYMLTETGGFNDFYDAFDRILLAEDSAWFGGEDRDTLWRRVAAEALQGQARTWGDEQHYMMAHVLLGGKLPRWLGFDRGPFVAEGGRATIRQGQIYRAAGRVTSFMPSLRIIADMSTDRLLTNLAGGPSDRRFSRWYVSDLDRWLAGEVKEVRP